ncbi:hypothetical protein BESB_055680 [Besnoitia besnoiti]|uniref:Apicomplexan specific, related protein n=1 Tax=Besnoitia besnoiti TaxID=94643 RepID=A0A2A9MJZ0_BESBE|nr:hypothetical protein BESB_055680 [Besnoitia besnoiti]PFH35917.1 hypothetical protein BESB_055680 [Besnoitia besnoiti]
MTNHILEGREYRHQETCPNRPYDDEDESDALSGDTDSEDEEDDDKREARKGFECCSDRRCTTWFDLRSWFGLLSSDLPNPDFKACFTDVAHGGIGLFEKLVVLGGKTLNTFAEIHFFEQFASVSRPYLPRELAEVAGADAPRLLWSQKRVERVTAHQALYAFGKSYLSTAQALPTRQAVSKYVKSCIGYSCQSSDTENLYKWMPVLVEHIFWVQRVRTEADTHANELLQDLQEYLGYRHDHLLPRIRECLRNRQPTQRSDTPTGKELIRLYAADYFAVLARESGVEKKNQAVWTDEELDMFMEGPAIPLFAVLGMSLQPFLMRTDSNDLPTTEVFVATFYSLVAACWVLSTESRVKVWMPALIQRLRQVQLLVQLASFEGNVYTRAMRRRRMATQPVELSQFAAANNGASDLFRLWNVDPSRPPAGNLGAGPQSPRLLQLGGPAEAASPGFALPGLSFLFGRNKKQEGAEGGNEARAARNNDDTALLPPGDRTLMLTDFSQPPGAVHSPTLTLRPFARVVPPQPRRARSKPPAGSAPAGCCLFPYGNPSPYALPPPPGESSCCCAVPPSASVAQHSAFTSGILEGPPLRRLPARAHNSTFLEGGPAEEYRRHCRPSTGDEPRLRQPLRRHGKKKGTTVTISLDDEEGAPEGGLSRRGSSCPTSPRSSPSPGRRLRSRGDEEPSGADSADVRAILVGKNMKPVCLNIKKGGADEQPSVFLTELGEEDKQQIGLEKADGRTRDGGGDDAALIRTQQMQLELQQLQLQQLQLQQELQNEALFSRRPPPLFPSGPSALVTRQREATPPAGVSLQLQVPPEVVDETRKLCGSAPSGGVSAATSSELPSCTLLVTPQPPPAGKSSGAEGPLLSGCQLYSQAAPQVTSAFCFPQPPMPPADTVKSSAFKPVDILAYTMPRPAPAPVRHDAPARGYGRASAPGRDPRTCASAPVCASPSAMQIPNLLLEARERGGARVAETGESRSRCWPAAACFSGPAEAENEGAASGLWCPGAEAGRTEDEGLPPGFVVAPAAVQAHGRGGPVFYRQRTQKL